MHETATLAPAPVRSRRAEAPPRPSMGSFALRAQEGAGARVLVAKVVVLVDP